MAKSSIIRKSMPFTSDDWRTVSRLVDSGRFRSWPEVVSDGLRRVVAAQRLHTALQQGIDELEAGLGVPMDQAFVEVKRRRAQRRKKTG